MKKKHTRDELKIGFCPFCKEDYEGVSECPVHELELVAAHHLPTTQAAPAWEEPLALYEARYGRGWLFVSSLMLMIGFLCPFLAAGHHDAMPQKVVEESAYELALTRAYNLWMIPSVSLFYFWILWSRRNLRSMNGARFVIFLLACFVLGSVGFTLWRIREANFRMHSDISMQWREGIVLIVVGCLLAFFSAVRFGYTKQSKN